MALLSNQIPPGPVPATNKTQLEVEIMGDPDPRRCADRAAVPPRYRRRSAEFVQTVGAYSVVGDIDFLYRKPRAGSGQQFGAAYDGTARAAGAGGMDIFYQRGLRGDEYGHRHEQPHRRHLFMSL